MKNLNTRLSKIEADVGIHDPSHGKPWHTIIVDDGQSKADAVSEYGIEKLGPDDNVIWVQLVAPRFDGNGRIVAPPRGDNKLYLGDWREECGL